MPEITEPGPVSGCAGIREAVCIHTKKIFDSCRDRDCVEDLRLYPTKSSQAIIDNALNVRPVSAQLLCTYINVDPVGFNRGYYTVDIRYFYNVTADAYTGAPQPVPIRGMAVFNKRVILFGGEGSARVFSSEQALCQPQNQTYGSLPTAVVTAVDPIVLSMRLVELTGCPETDLECTEIPAAVDSLFNEPICLIPESKRVYLTLGQFSIIRLERDAQLLIPAYDDCVPCKECSDTLDNDPCDVFRHVQFPMEQFFPPASAPQPDGSPGGHECCGCCE